MSTKAKKLKASDIPYEDNGLRYVVETASTGRSTCKRCKEKIEKGTLRFGSSSQGAFHGGWKVRVCSQFWHHLTCASSGQCSNALNTYNNDFASLPYFNSLSEDDKEAVRQHFE